MFWLHVVPHSVDDPPLPFSQQQDSFSDNAHEIVAIELGEETNYEDDAIAIETAATLLYDDDGGLVAPTKSHDTTSCPRRNGEIVIKGERHCGTNWVTFIINKNLSEEAKNVIDTSFHGWKHGFYPPVGMGSPFSGDEVRVVGKKRNSSYLFIYSLSQMILTLTSLSSPPM